MTFEGYAEIYMLEKGTHNYNVAESAWNAGQAAAEQRVKDLTDENKLLCDSIDGFIAKEKSDAIYHREKVSELQSKCADLERERGELKTANRVEKLHNMSLEAALENLEFLVARGEAEIEKCKQIGEENKALGEALAALKAQAIKPHQIRELVNELRDIAVKYHDHQSLRDRLSKPVHELWMCEREAQEKTMDYPTQKREGLFNNTTEAQAVSSEPDEYMYEWYHGNIKMMTDTPPSDGEYTQVPLYRSPPNHRAVMEQALEALEAAMSDSDPYINKSIEAIAALKEALK